MYIERIEKLKMIIAWDSFTLQTQGGGVVYDYPGEQESGTLA